MATRKKKYEGQKKSTSKTAPGRTAPPKKSSSSPSKGGWNWRSSDLMKKYAGKQQKKEAPKKKKNKFPSIRDFLASDQPYQTGLSDLQWALEQFKIENDAAQGDIQNSFGSAMDYMNLDKEKAHKFMQNDFGARGLVNSGMYPNAVSEYNKEWSMGAADLNRDLASQMRDLGFERQNMQQTTGMQKRDLRLDAIRRRSEQLQAKQFNNAAGYGGKKKKAEDNKPKASTNKQPQQQQRKTGVRKSGPQRLRKY